MSAVSIRCYVNTCSETIVNMTEFAEWAPCKTLLFTRKYPISNEKTIRLCFTHFLIYFLFFTINLSKSILTISIGKIKYVSIYFIFVMVFFIFIGIVLLQFLFHYAVIMLYERTTCCAKCDAPFDQDAVYLNTLGYRKE